MNRNPKRRPRGPFSPPSSPGRKTKIARGELIVFVLLALVVAVAYLALLRAQNSPPPEQPSFAVGEPVVLGDVEWTVTDVARGTTVARRSDGKGRGGVEDLYLITVDLSLMNRSDEALELGPQSLSLLDANDNKIPPATDLMRNRVENVDNMTYGEVDPNSTRQGQVVFNVPPGASGFALEVEDFRTFSSETGRVDLGL